jgi:quercetin dioxygenase-like cupin family protein
MIIKSLDKIPTNPVTMPGANQASMQMLLGPEERCPTFAMRKFTIAPGGYTPHHQHDFEHEVLVLAGEGTALSPQGPRMLKAGDVVYIPAGEMHQFQNTGKINFEFICLVPARVYQTPPCA